MADDAAERVLALDRAVISEAPWHQHRERASRVFLNDDAELVAVSAAMKVDMPDLHRPRPQKGPENVQRSHGKLPWPEPSAGLCVLGASSDHLVVEGRVAVGATMPFQVNYSLGLHRCRERAAG